jgi:hypothetical protein
VPYQLEQTGNYSALMAFISKPSHFTELAKAEHKFDLYRYWRTIPDQGALGMDDAFCFHLIFMV